MSLHLFSLPTLFPSLLSPHGALLLGMHPVKHAAVSHRLSSPFIPFLQSMCFCPMAWGDILPGVAYPHPHVGFMHILACCGHLKVWDSHAGLSLCSVAQESL